MEDSGRALEDDAGTVRYLRRFLLAGFEIMTFKLLAGLVVDDGVEDAVDNVGLRVAVIDTGAVLLVSRNGSTLG